MPTSDSVPSSLVDTIERPSLGVSKQTIAIRSTDSRRYPEVPP